MRLSTLLVRWRSGSAGPAQSGQILAIFALSIVVVLGMAGLAVDVGHAYERHQFVQGVATNAARAGAFEVLRNQRTSDRSPAQADQAVAQRMIATVQFSGLTVANSADLTATVASACSAGLQGNQVYLQARYVDSQDDPRVQPVRVGSGTMPAWAQGVQVTKVDMCVPHFFVSVLGFGNFDVASGSTVGQKLPPYAVGTVPLSDIETATAVAAATETAGAAANSTDTAIAGATQTAHANSTATAGAQATQTALASITPCADPNACDTATAVAQTATAVASATSAAATQTAAAWTPTPTPTPGPPSPTIAPPV